MLARLVHDHPKTFRAGPQPRSADPPQAFRAGPRSADGSELAPVLRLPLRRVEGKRERDPHELLRGVLEGDAGAQGEVWDTFSPVLRGVLRRSLGPWADVEDALQEVFLTFFRVAGTLRDPSALRPFLIGIAMRVARSELRKRRVRRWFFLTDDGNVPEHASKEDDGDAREAVRRLYAILDTLDPESRLAFILRHIEGLELEEVARSLGLSLATTKRRLAKVVPVVHARVRADAVLAPYADEAEGTAEASRTAEVTPIFTRRLATEEAGR